MARPQSKCLSHNMAAAIRGSLDKWSEVSKMQYSMARGPVKGDGVNFMGIFMTSAVKISVLVH
jgi:hypothetical protein